MWTPDPSIIITAEMKAAEVRAGLHVAVNAERDRRILAGVAVEVVGIGPIPLQGRPADQINMMALSDTARELQTAGITAPIIPFRDGDNVEHILTAAQMLEANNKGKQWVSAVYQASWAIKAMDPLPADVTADHFWP